MIISTQFKDKFRWVNQLIFALISALHQKIYKPTLKILIVVFITRQLIYALEVQNFKVIVNIFVFSW